MKKFAGILLAGLLLTGCGVAPVLPAVVTPQQAEAQPRKLTPEQSRRLLATGGSAIWGVTYTQTHSWGNGYNKVWRATGGKWGGYWDEVRYEFNFVTPNMTPSIKGEMIKASTDRYVYQVPEGQVLVVNLLEGKGAVYLNGYGLGIDGERRNVQYMFGAGELVTIKFAPAYSHRYNSDSKRSESHTSYYHTVAVSGFTADPSVLGNLGGLMGK